MTAPSPRTPIAIVGVSAIFPGSTDRRGFWRDIVTGKDLLSEVPENYWLIDDYYDPDPKAPDRTYGKRGGFLGLTDFDPLKWGVPPSIVPATDTLQLLALVVARRVLEDAVGGNLDDLDKDRVGVILGVTSGQKLMGSMIGRLQRPMWIKGMREAGIPEDEVQRAVELTANNYVPWQESTFPGLLGNVVAGRIANRLDLGGINCVTDAACASSFAAMRLGVAELESGRADLIVSGGTDTMNDIFMYMCFSKTPALSMSGDCRPFSDKADGTILGEGLCMVALKRLDDAERDGDTIWAVVKGIGASSDGRSKSVYAPVAEGQASAVRRAYADAGYGPDTVELVEAHGTGTVAGDAAEFDGLRMSFAESGRTDSGWCALGSVKSQIGHTKAAAGAAGLFKAVMALRHGILPPTIKIDRPNPKLDIENSPFTLSTQARPWIRGSDYPRRAGVSSFGFGGSNFHVAVEEYVGPGTPAARLRTVPSDLVSIAAQTPGELTAQARKLASEAESGGEGMLARIAWGCQTEPSEGPARLAVVATDEDDLAKRLRAAADAIDKDPTASLTLPGGTRYAVGADPGKVALLFPGQGSQRVGMGADLAMALPLARGVWDRAGDTEFAGGERLHQVVFPPPAFDDAGREAAQRKLTLTQWAQPAIGVASLATWEILRKLGLSPACVGGHSFGEVTALAAAGTLDEAGLLAVARARGELMAKAAANGASGGAMAAVKSDFDSVRQVLAKLGDAAVIANHNAPDQVVISGPSPAVEAARNALKADGINSQMLPVATAFHSPLVAGACKPFSQALDATPFAAPTLQAWSGATAAPHPDDPAQIRAALASAIAEPVRFVEQIEAMYAAGVRTFVEVGPGSVLTGLVGRILGDRPHTAIATDRKGKNGVTALWEALGALMVAGIDLDLTSLWDEMEIPLDPVVEAAKLSKAALQISGANYGAPYPPKGGSAALPKPNPARPEPEPVIVVKEVIKEVVKEVLVPSGPVAEATQPAAASQAPPQPSASGWVSAYEETLRLTTQAHGDFQRMMGDSHLAYLRVMEAAATGRPAQGVAPAPSVSAPTFAAPRPAPTSPPPLAAIEPEPVAAALPIAPPVVTAAPAPTAPIVASPTVAPMAESASPAPVVQAVAVDLRAQLLAVVADKTGYPVEMLTEDMDLEADLGVDSIKRVEILSALHEAVPGLPDVEARELAALRTLGEIADKFDTGEAVAAPPAAAKPASTSSATAPAPPASEARSVDLRAQLLAVVADKTGYPVEMLTEDMDLEADLGVDSIKRVEILSALHEAVPGLPDVEARELASLRTLGEIADKFDTGPPAPAAAVPASAPSAVSSVDLRAQLLAVVADKTGYPVEMLTEDMDLEADLGVDSIKRVEILSALHEAVPGLPDVEARELAALRTLGEIAAKFDTGAPGPTPTTPASPASATTAAPAVDLRAQLLEVVAEKTGYPVEMLTEDMDLEADLGVDSIKRVEILSALHEAVPSLPDVEARELAALRTLGEIAAKFDTNPAAPAAEAEAEADPAPVPEATPAAEIVPLGRWALELIDAPAVGLSQPGLHKGGVAILGGGDIAPALVQALAARGIQAAAFAEAPADANAVIHLGGLSPIAGPSDGRAVARSAFAAAKAVAPLAGGLFVTVQDTGGDFGLSGAGDRAWVAGLPGLIKTAAQEWPGASVKAIDIEIGGRSPGDIAQALVAELLGGGPEIEVALSAEGSRRTLVSVPRSIDTADRENIAGGLVDGDVIVASGGARGVTAAGLIALSKRVKARFVLLGRTPLADEPASCAGAHTDAEVKQALLADAKAAGELPKPAELGARTRRILAAREVRSTLAALEAAGAQARYVSVDVQDSAALATCFEQVRSEWGPIAGIVHGAGVLADKLIADKDPGDFDRVYDTKVLGLSALLQATADDDLKLIALFSSVAGRCGNQGQSDYAMANEVLNKVAQSEAARRGAGCVVRSLGWGPWAGGMVTPALAAAFEQSGVALIPLDAGAEMFADEALHLGTDVEVVLGGEPRAEALTSPGEEGRPIRLALLVDKQSHPHLDDHRIDGRAVAPMAQVLQWFIGAAKTAGPGHVAVHDLRVLRPIFLDGLDAGGDWILITVRPDGEGLSLRAEGPDGAPLYGARAEVSATAHPTGDAPTLPELEAAPEGPTYDGHLLFHGPRFQVIDLIEGLAETAAATQMSLGDLPPVVGAVDGALQLALLWTRRALGGDSLPMAIRSYTAGPGAFDRQPLRCLLVGKAKDSQRAICDVVLLDAAGEVVIELGGIETVLRPSEGRSSSDEARP